MTRRKLVLIGAYLWAMTAILVARLVFRGHPPYGFGDLFLIGPALVAVANTWKQAIMLFVCSLGTMAFIDPPTGVKIFGYTMLSLTGVVVIWALESSKRRRVQK